MPSQHEVQKWLNTVELVTDPHALDSQQRADIEQLLGHEGMRLLLGLLTATRQGLYVQLANTPLHTPEGQRMGSVIQGQIMGLDQVALTLLELATPAGPEGAKE